MPRNVRPAVIVGLGGTGKEIMMRVRRRIEEDYGTREKSGLEQLPIFQFMLIDADPSSQVGFDVGDMEERIKLNDAERVSATVSGVGRLWENIRGLPHLERWLSDKVVGAGDAVTGANQVRHLGRLCLFQNYADINAKLRGTLSRAIDPKNPTAVSGLGFTITGGVKPEYYLISSVCGGTGSGMFLDVAYLIRQHHGKDDPSPTTAFLIMPDAFAFADAGRIKPNSYAALKELDYYNRRGKTFRAQYQGGQAEVAITGSPFNLCYLLSTSNGEVAFGGGSGLDDFYEMIAHQVYLHLLSDFAEHRKSYVDANWGPDLKLSTDHFGWPMSYLSFGLAAIQFPGRRVRAACANRLAARTIQLWLGADQSEPSEAELTRQTQNLLTSLNLLESEESHQLIESLGKDEKGESLLTTIARWAEQMREEARGLDYPSIGPRLDEEFDRFFGRLKNDADPARRGALTQQMYLGMDRLLDHVQDELRTRMDQELKAFAGPRNVRALLLRFEKWMRDTQERLRQDLIADSQHHQTLMSYQERLRQSRLRLDRYIGAYTFAKRQVVQCEIRNWSEWAAEVCKCQVRLVARAVAVEFIRRLLEQERKSTETRRSVRQLVGELEELTSLLEHRRDRLNSQSDKEAAAAARTIDKGRLLYDEERGIEPYYQQAVTNNEKEATTQLSREVLEGVSLLQLLLSRDIFGPKLWQRCMEVVQRLKDVSASQLLAKKGQAELESIVRNAHRHSNAFLSVTTNVPGLPSNLHVEGESVFRQAGVHGGTDAPDEATQAVVKVFGNIDSSLKEYTHHLDSSEEVLFGHTIGVFPLRAITQFSEWEAAYHAYQGVPGALPVHYHKDNDHLREQPERPLTDEQRATALSVVARAIGVIPRPESGVAVIFSYRDASGLQAELALPDWTNSSQIGHALNGTHHAWKWLSQQVEVYCKARQSDSTPDEIAARCQTYLDGLLGRTGKKENPTYQDEDHVLREFLISYRAGEEALRSCLQKFRGE